MQTTVFHSHVNRPLIISYYMYNPQNLLTHAHLHTHTHARTHTHTHSLRLNESDEFSMDMSSSLELTSLFTPTLNQTLVDLDKLTVDETRDLLISILFVLKNIDKCEQFDNSQCHCY